MSAKPLVAWMGGKRKLAKHILPKFPEHTCYVEPFSGGAALFFMRPVPAKVEVLNDANGDLINLYRVVQHHADEFIRQFNHLMPSREVFYEMKCTSAAGLTDIQRAVRFYYLQQLCFGSKVDARTFGYATTAPPKLNLKTLQEKVMAVRDRLLHTYIENVDWRDCIARYDRAHTLFYLDPPYWQTAGYGGDFGFEQYEIMADMMRGLKGKAILSINDHPDIVNTFKGFRIERLETTYTVRGHGKRKASSELLIFSD